MRRLSSVDLLYSHKGELWSVLTGRARFPAWMIALILLVILVLDDTTPEPGVVYAVIPLAAVLAGVSALTGVANTVGGWMGQAKTRAANMELAKYSYAKDLEMWNLQNQYNTPQAQMERYKAAGLNPNLIYGQGSPGNANQLPKFQAPTVKYEYPVPDLVGGIGDVLSQFQDVRLKQAQVDNAKVQRQIMETKAASDQYLYDYGISSKTRSIQEKATQDLIKSERMQRELNEMFPYQLEYAKGKVSHQSQQVRKMIQETRLKELEADWYIGNVIAKMGAGLMKFIPGKAAGKGVQRALPKAGAAGQRAFERTTEALRRFGNR